MKLDRDSKFVIGFEISKVFPEPSLVALGCMSITINGVQYGVADKDASFLACSRDAIEQRIEEAGSFLAPEIDEMDAAELAKCVLIGRYADSESIESLRYNRSKNIYQYVCENQILWIPDGDSAFDDGSHILHMDAHNGKVRLVGWKKDGEISIREDTLQDLWLESSIFYGELSNWLKRFTEVVNRQSQLE